MPGKKITDHQVHKYKQHRNKLTPGRGGRQGRHQRAQRAAHRSAATRCPRSAPARSWRTRADPLAAVWDAEVVPLLKADAQLNAVTLLEELQRRHPGAVRHGVLRTLQRRVRQWRAAARRRARGLLRAGASAGPAGAVGLHRLPTSSASRSTASRSTHRLYQFALAHSGWRHATVVDGGESFLALSTGLQAALWRLGGVPEEHRTDSLSAAFNNLAEAAGAHAALRRRCASHYGMRASRCNPGQSHENGSIESRHDSLKTALDQALRLRGSRCFDERAAYEAFVEQIVQRCNARVAKRLVDRARRCCARCRRGARPSTRRCRRG